MKILLTGITGLVGASVVTALLRKHPDYQIVAICRGNKAQTARQRVELTIKEQCEFDKDPESYDAIMRNIEVIQGDVTAFPFEEVAKHAPFDVMFHCAADVNLANQDTDGRIRKTNMGGTMQAIEAIKRFNIPRLQYVSTAYVAGRSVGRVMEDEQPATAWINAYEQSKYDAELYVREHAGVPFTIYRPSIIVGRLSDGVIRKPLAFYRILEFFGRLKSNRAFKLGVRPCDPIDMPIRIQTTTSDKIYFVPVDYVQFSISTLFEKPECNRTYHITGDSPVSTEMIAVAVSDFLKLTGIALLPKVENPSLDEQLVMKMIADLIPYFQTQIIFDQTNVRADLPPESLDFKLDDEFLRRMAYSYYKQEFPALVEDREPPVSMR